MTEPDNSVKVWHCADVRHTYWRHIVRIVYPTRIVPGSIVTIEQHGKVSISDPHGTPYNTIGGDDAIGFFGYDIDMRQAPRIAMLIANVLGLRLRITRDEEDLFQVVLYKNDPEIAPRGRAQ